MRKYLRNLLMKFVLLLLTLFSLQTLAWPQEVRTHTTLQSSGASEVSANKKLSETPLVKTREDKNFLYIESNGIPDHLVGQFPNSGNPNSISSQKYEFRITKNPKINPSPTKIEMRMDFGVALNGVPFDPAAAEWYKGERNSKWQYDALSGAVSLGIDQNHAHVQPTGAYHYHGLPTAYLQSIGLKAGSESPLVGYAADGHPIYALYAEKGETQKSSYRLKKGVRTIGGKYDGTFTADYEFVKGSGTLDECNGRIIHGKYAYFLTNEYPVIPRCFRGTPDSSFNKKPQPSNSYQHGNAPGAHTHPPRGTRRGPPREALTACQSKRVGDSCSFKTPRGEVRGTCFSPPVGGLACRP